MEEKIRLAEEIEKLKTTAPQDDEFAQFARQAVYFLDAMDRIVEAGKKHAQSEEIKAWLQGVEAAYQRMIRLFEKHGLKVVSCLGDKVDLGVHDVVEYRKTDRHAHNTIIEEMQKGMIFRGKVLRDARVVVACNEGS